MTDFLNTNNLKYGYFVLFRYGAPKWIEDAEALKMEFNKLQHYYLSSHH